MNLRNKPDLVERLAAEYVLGTLKGGARRRFETWLGQNAAMRRSVAEWQNKLMPLAQYAPAVSPSPKVWQQIERRLRLKPASPWQQWLDSVHFWRNLGLASSALAASLVLVLAVWWQQPGAPELNYVAALENDKAQTVALVTGDNKHHQLNVKLIQSPDLTPEQALQLWAVPKQGNPRSLGLIAVQRASGGGLILPLPDNISPQDVPLLAISLEPKGGSTNPNGPSGPILFKGAWLTL